MNVSSMVLSTALSDPGIKERATAIAPFLSRSVAPGCVVSRLVRNMSSHAKYLVTKSCCSSKCYTFQCICKM